MLNFREQVSNNRCAHSVTPQLQPWTRCSEQPNQGELERRGPAACYSSGTSSWKQFQSSSVRFRNHKVQQTEEGGGGGGGGDGGRSRA